MGSWVKSEDAVFPVDFHIYNVNVSDKVIGFGLSPKDFAGTLILQGLTLNFT